MVPPEFRPDAEALGYGDGCGWDEIERAWDEMEEETKAFGAAYGFDVYLESRRVWGIREGETYLLASADPTEDAMNLWAMAYQRLDLIIDLYLEKATLRGQPECQPPTSPRSFESLLMWIDSKYEWLRSFLRKRPSTPT